MTLPIGTKVRCIDPEYHSVFGKVGEVLEHHQEFDYNWNECNFQMCVYYFSDYQIEETTNANGK